MAGSVALEKTPLRPILTIGNFDGLHIGHRKIIRTVVTRARGLCGQAVLYTFEPHPRKVLQRGRAPGLLVTVEQKLELLEKEGIDLVVLEPFTREFACTAPETFVRDHVYARIRPLEVYVGYDFHFGRDREGSMRLLTEMGPRLGFAVTIIPEVTIGDRDVNSTRIRALLMAGAVDEAALLLGRPYTVRGGVVAGDRRGHRLGFPTANLSCENEILPADGVYAGRVRLLEAEGREEQPGYDAVTNVGRRPTFVTEQDSIAEAHLIGFQGDLYGRRIELSFVSRLRAERRFPGAEALRAQIEKDVAAARRVLAGR